MFVIEHGAVVIVVIFRIKVFTISNSQSDPGPTSFYKFLKRFSADALGQKNLQIWTLFMDGTQRKIL